jgi:hypothetical protein
MNRPYSLSENLSPVQREEASKSMKGDSIDYQMTRKNIIQGESGVN